MLLEIGLLFLLLFIIFYRFITKDFGYFTGQNLSVSKPSFPFGSSNVKKMFTGKITFLDVQADLVKDFPNDKIVGYFMFQSPRYLINDWDLAKQILIKDFEYFTDRPAFPDADPIVCNFMTNLSGAQWKKMRMLMSGVFTSGRLRLMSPHIAEAGQNFAKYIDKISQEGTEIDMKDTGGMLTLDSIASAGFGLQVDSFADPNNTFRLQALALVGAKGYTEQNPMWGLLKVLINQAWPWLGIEVLKLKILPPKAVAFFSDIIRKTYQQRLATNQKRNDLIDLVIEEMTKSGKEKSKTSANDDQDVDEFEANAAMDTSDLKEDTKFEDEEIVLISNAFLFFFAGFDTSATGFGLVCHKLCLHEDKQELVYEEIMDVIGKDGPVTFDKLGQLKYMDRFISESLRFNKLFPQIERVCTKNYKIPGTDIVIPKGRVVNLFTLNFTYDEKNFYNPNQFDPENFNPENNPNKFGFSSFGQGPRNCIGMRYALLVLKVGLVNLLRNHKIKRGSTMQDELIITKDLKHFEGRLPATIHRREQ